MTTPKVWMLRSNDAWNLVVGVNTRLNAKIGGHLDGGHLDRTPKL